MCACVCVTFFSKQVLHCELRKTPAIQRFLRARTLRHTRETQQRETQHTHTDTFEMLENIQMNVNNMYTQVHAYKRTHSQTECPKNTEIQNDKHTSNHAKDFSGPVRIPDIGQFLCKKRVGPNKYCHTFVTESSAGLPSFSYSNSCLPDKCVCVFFWHA